MRYQSIIVLLLLSFGVTKCDWSDDPTLTDQLIEIGLQVPAYGGVSWNGSGQPTVFVLDSDSLSSARKAVFRILGRSTNIEVKGAPPAGALLDWRERLGSVQTVNGVVYFGLHPTGKYVAIGTATAESVTKVEEFLLAADYPASAVIIRVVGYPREEMQ